MRWRFMYNKSLVMHLVTNRQLFQVVDVYDSLMNKDQK